MFISIMIWLCMELALNMFGKNLSALDSHPSSKYWVKCKHVGHLADFVHENVIYCFAVLLVVLLNTLLHTVHEGTCVRSSAVYSSWVNKVLHTLQTHPIRREHIFVLHDSASNLILVISKWKNLCKTCYFLYHWVMQYNQQNQSELTEQLSCQPLLADVPQQSTFVRTWCPFN